MPIAIYNFYPVLIALAGGGVAALVKEGVLAQLSYAQKETLHDASARQRWLDIAGIFLFWGLLYWNRLIAWVTLVVEYLCLSAIAVIHLRRLEFPKNFTRRLILGVIVREIGFVACIALYAMRLF